MINKLQDLKDKNTSNYYDNMNIRMDEDPFAKNAQGICKSYHEVLLLMKFLQTKPQFKNMNIKYYDLYYIVIKNGDEKKFVDNKHENDYIFNDIITNQKISITPRETTLR